MEQMNNQWFWAAIVGFLIGAVIVWLFMRNGKNKDEESIATLQKEYDQYRENVNAHFAKTADAVDNLTKSYQDVFTHLSKGAETLMDKKALQAQLEKRQGKAVTLAYLVDEKEGTKGQSTKIEQQSVVDHQTTLAKPKQSQTAKPAQPSVQDKPVGSSQTKPTMNKVNPTPHGKTATKQASDNIHVKTTGQSVPLDHKTSTNTQQANTDKTKSANTAQNKTDMGRVNPNASQAQNTQDKAQRAARPVSQTTTVNTTNQPAVSTNNASANEQQRKSHQPVRAESNTTTINTTNQPASAKTSGKHAQVKDDEASASDTPEITPAQEAALKAGLKPASVSKATSADASTKLQERQESAIETVKRHIRDNNKPS